MKHTISSDYDDMVIAFDEVKSQLTRAHAFIMHVGQWQQFLQGEWAKEFLVPGRAELPRYGDDPSAAKLLAEPVAKRAHKVS